MDQLPKSNGTSQLQDRSNNTDSSQLDSTNGSLDEAVPNQSPLPEMSSEPVELDHTENTPVMNPSDEPTVMSPRETEQLASATDIVQSLLEDSQNGAVSMFEIEQEGEDTDPASEGDGVATKQTSILKHIMSQIRVGMDLTKFTLPAFLLAPRSMLHMYASLFGRPYMITDVADQPTPSGRMTAVVKWFLGSLSSSRKDPAPKKPYNPILGETFNCYWDLPDVKRAGDHTLQPVEGGPFPQAGPDSFSFLAEQVSHHPPVSAIYAECTSKKMYVSATICSKTKLTSSLAVKAHNTGLFRICLLEHGEEYVTALPDGYVRGVLKTPWFEFGGQCVVECAKTGHSAKITLHTKPKVSKQGKKNRVSGELTHKLTKKPYLTFEGEWDSTIYSKAEDGQPELFFDASTPTLPKKMKKLSCAEPTDSRLVWRPLTEALLADNGQGAGEAKHQVEEIQREKARERQKTGEVHKQQHFHLSKDNPSLWEYNSPLNKRLGTPT